MSHKSLVQGTFAQPFKAQAYKAQDLNSYLDPSLMGTIELDAKDIVRKELDPVFVWLSFLVVVAALLAAPIFQHIFGMRALKRKMARGNEPLLDGEDVPVDHAIAATYDGGFDRDTQYEFDKLQRQLVDHERTIQSLQYERDEAYESVHAYDAELRRTQEALQANQVTLDAARHQAEGPHPLEQRVALLRQVLADMENYWLNPRASVESCRTLLQDHAWVLEPEYIVDHLDANQALDRLVPSLFQRTPNALPGASGARSLRVDLCGWTNGVASLQPALASQERMLLLVHMMRPDETVTRSHIQDAYVMCTGMLNLAGNELWGATVDCLVIGGSLDADVNDLHLRFGRDAHSAVRVIPVSYQQLYWRAQAMTQTMLGDDVEAYAAEPSLPPVDVTTSPAATETPPLTEDTSPGDTAWQMDLRDLDDGLDDESGRLAGDTVVEDNLSEDGLSDTEPEFAEGVRDDVTAELEPADGDDDLDIESAPSGTEASPPATEQPTEKSDEGSDEAPHADASDADDTSQRSEKKSKMPKFSLRRQKPSADAVSGDAASGGGNSPAAQPLAASSNDNSPAEKPAGDETKGKPENVEALPSKSAAKPQTKPQSKPADLLSLSQRLAKKSAEKTGAPLKVAQKPKRWR